MNSFISEGVAVLFDQSKEDHIKATIEMMRKNHVTQVDVKALWNNFFILSSEISYPLSAVFSENLLCKFGREKYLEIIRTQTYDEVCCILGKEQVDDVIGETQEVLNKCTD